MRQRLTLDSMVDDFLDMNRFSRSKRYQKPEPALPSSQTTFSRFINTDKHSVHTARQQERTDLLLGLNRYHQKVAAKMRPEMIFNQAATLALKLFAEIARHPDAFMRLSLAETAAMSTSAKPVTARTADPKAALRLAAIQAMNQAYPVKAAVLNSAVNKVEDHQQKEQLEREALMSRLQELGYSPSEAKKVAPKLEEKGLSRFVLSGTLSNREDLDNVLRASQAAKKAAKTLA